MYTIEQVGVKYAFKRSSNICDSYKLYDMGIEFPKVSVVQCIHAAGAVEPFLTHPNQCPTNSLMPSPLGHRARLAPDQLHSIRIEHVATPVLGRVNHDALHHSTPASEAASPPQLLCPAVSSEPVATDAGRAKQLSNRLGLELAPSCVVSTLSLFSFIAHSFDMGAAALLTCA